MDADRLVEGLTAAQRAAVTSDAKPLCILAGAGSGKTRVLTNRIAWRAATGDLDPRHVLALTFTRKAAGEMGSRLRKVGLRDSLAAGTFHSVAYAQLRARWADKGIRPPTLLDRKVGFVARLLPPELSRLASPLELVSEIEWAKARVILPGDYPSAASAAGRRTPVEPGAVADVYARYEAEKRRRRMVDFDDLLRLCKRDLDEDREFAAAQRWRFRHFFVDEFQDVNPAQHQLLQAWLGDRADLCVVGDPNQSIYSWNGADSSYLRAMASPGSGAEVVRLLENHRSTPEILRAANAVLQGSAGGGGDRGRRRAGARAPGAEALVPTRPTGPAPTVRSAADDTAEAAMVARTVRDKHRPGASWSEQAVLVRTHAQVPLIESALKAAGVPHRVRGSSGLMDQPAVQRALLQLSKAPDLPAALADLEEVANRADDETSTDLAALARLGRDYSALTPSPQVGGFVAWLHASQGDHPDSRGDAVEVATFHAAKGLEWPIVHLAGLEQGLVPISHAKDPEALAEESRLLYVALTRAERELHCTWAEQRTFGSRTVRRSPSEMLDAMTGAEPGARPGAKPRRLVRSQPRPSAHNGLSDPDAGILAALREWRRSVARAASVPAYVVFNDRTLEAIATARPSTPDELHALPGIGEVKMSRYGDELLRLVSQAS